MLASALGSSVASWGSTLLTDARADSSPLALVALRVAARRVRAIASNGSAADIEFDTDAATVTTARIRFSEDGQSPTPVSVSRVGDDAEGPFSWEEHPVLGHFFWVRLRARAVNGSATWVSHALELTAGVPDGDVNVLAHTWSAVTAPQIAQVAVDAAGAVGGEDAGTRIRALSFNVWNSNPPRWLFRDPRDRFRQYLLRIATLGESLRRARAGIIAFQEVRYDSTLGGFDSNPWAESSRREARPAPPASDTPEDAAAARTGVLTGVSAEVESPAARAHATMPEIGRHVAYSFGMAFAVSSMWFNKTAEFSQTDKYRDRNKDRWSAVTSAAAWSTLGSQHEYEGIGAGVGGDGASPFLGPIAEGPPSWAAEQAAAMDHPHAQIEHLAAALPGFQYVHAAAQMYLDKDVWGRSEGPGRGGVQRDEEGPAIFSQWPITHSDSLLLSRDGGDDGDGHQRACLHAVIDATEASPTKTPLLIDVYTAHLSLSEAARKCVQRLRFLDARAPPSL